MSNNGRRMEAHGHNCSRCGNDYDCKSAATCRLGRNVDDCAECYNKEKVDGVWVPKSYTKFK